MLKALRSRSYHATGYKAQSHGRIIGAPVPPEPAVSIGKQWVFVCKNNHPLCVATEETPLPTRLLDVGPIDGSQHPRLRITEGVVGQYATLSHRWGQSQPVSLTKTTCSPYLQRIPFPSLPKTFQDAVTVTRQLGFQYLWIDSLVYFKILAKIGQKSASKCQAFTRMPKSTLLALLRRMATLDFCTNERHPHSIH